MINFHMLIILNVCYTSYDDKPFDNEPKNVSTIKHSLNKWTAAQHIYMTQCKIKPYFISIAMDIQWVLKSKRVYKIIRSISLWITNNCCNDFSVVRIECIGFSLLVLGWKFPTVSGIHIYCPWGPRWQCWLLLTHSMCCTKCISKINYYFLFILEIDTKTCTVVKYLRCSQL